MPITITLRTAVQLFQAIEMMPVVYDPKANYNLGYIASHCKQHLAEFERTREKMRPEREAIPEGTIPEGTSGDVRAQVERHRKKAFEAELEQMLDVEVTINRDPIKYAAIMGPDPDAKMTDEQVRQLEARRPKIQPHIFSRLVPIIEE